MGLRRLILVAGLLAAVAAAQPSPSPSPPPPHSQEATHSQASSPGTNVMVHGRTAFVLHSSDAERARAAGKILAALVEEHAQAPVTLAGDTVRVGDTELIHLAPGDAGSLEPQVYYQSVRSEVERFLQRERRRAQLQEGVLSVSMAVFLGLLTLLGIRWLGRRAEAVRGYIEERAHKAEGLRVRQLEVLSPQAVESLLLALVGIGAFLGRVGLVYSYLVYALSRFELTRSWVPGLTRAVASPFAALFERVGAALPAALLLVFGAYLVRGGLRIVRVFLDHVARGELRPRWLSADMAAPARPVATVLLVLVALVTLGPVVSGASDGVLSRVGLLGMFTLALGAVPAVASIFLGVAIIFSRRYELGNWVQIGQHTGEVTSISFLDVTLVPLGSGRVRVPHLLTLFVTVRHLAGPPPAVEVDIPVSSGSSAAEVMKVLKEALAPLGASTVQLASLSREAAWYRVSLPEAHPDTRSDVLARAAEALAAAQIPLGKA
jgi:small-conductance mechanosensitive channel